MSSSGAGVHAAGDTGGNTDALGEGPSEVSLGVADLPASYGFTCRGCDTMLDYSLAELTAALPEAQAERDAITRKGRATVYDAADLLRRRAGWGLTPCEYPFDGNAHYYCPHCHTPDEHTG